LQGLIQSTAGDAHIPHYYKYITPFSLKTDTPIYPLARMQCNSSAQLSQPYTLRQIDGREGISDIFSLQSSSV